MSDTKTDVPLGFTPFHSSEDSDRVLPAIGFGSRAVIFVDTGGDLVTLAGVLASRCEQLCSLVSLIARSGDGTTTEASDVASILEPSAELLVRLADVVVERLQADRRRDEHVHSAERDAP